MADDDRLAGYFSLTVGQVDTLEAPERIRKVPKTPIITEAPSDQIAERPEILALPACVRTLIRRSSIVLWTSRRCTGSWHADPSRRTPMPGLVAVVSERLIPREGQEPKG